MIDPTNFLTFILLFSKYYSSCLINPFSTWNLTLLIYKDYYFLGVFKLYSIELNNRLIFLLYILSLDHHKKRMTSIAREIYTAESDVALSLSHITRRKDNRYY